MAEDMHVAVDLGDMTPADKGMQVGVHVVVPMLSQIANADDVPAAERHHVFGGALAAQIAAMNEVFGTEATLQVIEELKKALEPSAAPSMH